MLLYPCADTTPILNNSKSKQGSIPVYQFTRYTGLVYQQTTTIHYKSISKKGILKTIKIVTLSSSLKQYGSETPLKLLIFGLKKGQPCSLITGRVTQWVRPH